MGNNVVPVRHAVVILNHAVVPCSEVLLTDSRLAEGIHELRVDRVLEGKVSCRMHSQSGPKTMPVDAKGSRRIFGSHSGNAATNLSDNIKPSFVESSMNVAATAVRVGGFDRINIVDPIWNVGGSAKRENDLVRGTVVSDERLGST